MSWTDSPPPWLPPLPPPHRGRWLIVPGLVILGGTFVFIVAMAYVGGTHTLYTLCPLVIGLGLVIAGMLRRNKRR